MKIRVLIAATLLFACMTNSPSLLHAETTSYSNAYAITSLPYTCSASGTYYLNQPLTSTAATGSAITVNASNVTIDLNGYTITNTSGIANTCNGIYASNLANIHIQNGTISGFYFGCRIITTSAYDATCSSYGHLLENVTFLKNTYCGATVGGVGSRIYRCRSILTGGTTQGPLYYNFNYMGASNAVVDCDICGVISSVESHGIQGGYGSNNFVVGNRINGVTKGIVLNSDAKYRDNLTSGVTTPFTGGTDAGNNGGY